MCTDARRELGMDHPKPILAVAMAISDDLPEIEDPALLGEGELDQIDGGAMDFLPPAPAEETLGTPMGYDLHKCAALVLWACCEREKDLEGMFTPADVLGFGSMIQSLGCELRDLARMRRSSTRS